MFFAGSARSRSVVVAVREPEPAVDHAQCDETKPTCNNCVAYGKECPGYRQFVPLIFRDESQKAAQLVRRGRRRGKKSLADVSADGMQLVRTAPDPRQLTIPRFLLDSSWECHGHCYFRDQFTLPVEPDGSPGPLDSIPLLYTLCREGRDGGAPVASLRAAMDAAAFASLANRANIPALAVQARRKYGEALRELSLSLRSVEDAVRNETLGAIVLLMLFEDINSERNSLMSVHLSGIQYLLKLRGAGQLGDPATRSLFHFAFTQMVRAFLVVHGAWLTSIQLIQFIGLKDPMQIDLDWLLEVLTVPHPIYNMMAANINISKFCASVSQILSRIDSDHPPDRLLLASFLDRGEHLDLEFNQWHHGLPEAWLPRKVHSPVGETMILYPDPTAAGVWNYYRGTKIILHQAILDIQRHLDVASHLLTSGQTFVLPTPEEMIKQMIAEICESLPFALGDVDISGNATPRAGRMQPSIKAIQGFALLWPIFSITQNEHATPTQKAQARRALKRIASTHGIRLGMDLGCETIQLERLVSPSSSRVSVSTR